MNKIALMLCCTIMILGSMSCKKSFQCVCEGRPGYLGGTNGQAHASIEIKTTTRSKAKDRCLEIRRGSGAWESCVIN